METMTTSPVDIADSTLFSEPLEKEKEKEEELSDCEADPTKCDFFFTKFSTTPSYFLHDRTQADDLLLEILEKHQLSNDNYYKEDDIEDHTLKYELGLMLCAMPEDSWGIFRKIDNPAHLKQAIQLAATLLLFLIPKEMLCRSPRYTKQATQLNELWEKLSLLLNPPVPDSPVEEAFWLIMSLTKDRQKYSLVTETDVSRMIDRFCAILNFSSPYPLHPYRRTGNELKKNQTPWFKEIMEVIDNIESPPMLKDDDYTRLLMKVVSEKPDKQWLLPKLNFKLFPYSYSGEECSPPLLKLGFDNLVYRVIAFVKVLMIGPMAYVLRPVRNFYGRGFDTHISPEVHGLIDVAEVRRIALGSRFISRSHLLWAFYECGHVLPPQIRDTIKLTSAEENHPPYHIYLASLKLAECFSEKVRLENFIFSVINSEDVGLSVDRREMFKIKWRYEDFLKALDNPSSNIRSKRLRSGEFQVMMGGKAS